jgi:hypothetical protein
MESEAARCEAAFNTLRRRLEEISVDDIDRPRTSPQRAANAARSVAEYAARPEVRVRFERLARGVEFRLELLDELFLAADAAWHTRQRLEDLQQNQGEGRVAAAVHQEATTLRTRMLRVLEYHLGDHPALAARLAAIRGGKGPIDLANDLIALADLYRQHQAELVDDRRHYRADDASAATSVAAEITRQLSGGAAKEVERWTELQARAWTLLQQIYEEVRRAGQFLFYYEDPEAKFPSLFAAARTARGRARD